VQCELPPYYPFVHTAKEVAWFGRDEIGVAMELLPKTYPKTHSDLQSLKTLVLQLSSIAELEVL
jgi:hypothetical protein